MYETNISENELQVASLEVAFMTGLGGFRLDSVKFIDQGIYSNGNRNTRRIQFQVGLVNLNFQAERTKLSLPILVRMQSGFIVGKYEAKPCCNPQRLTLTLNLNCQRHYPFFSLPPQNESVNVSIEPPDAVDINLSGFGNLSNYGIDREFIEGKLAHLVAQYVNATINTASVPGLSTFYPNPQLTLADGLSFFIGSNLPISSFSEWEFCPESSA